MFLWFTSVNDVMGANVSQEVDLTHLLRAGLDHGDLVYLSQSTYVLFIVHWYRAVVIMIISSNEQCLLKTILNSVKSKYCESSCIVCKIYFISQIIT